MAPMAPIEEKALISRIDRARNMHQGMDNGVFNDISKIQCSFGDSTCEVGSKDSPRLLNGTDRALTVNSHRYLTGFHVHGVDHDFHQPCKNEVTGEFTSWYCCAL